MHPIQNVKKAVKKVVKFVVALPFMIKIFSIMMITVIAITAVDFVVELFTANNNPELMYSTFKVKDMSELVEIKKSDDGSGYYLDFVSDFDEKVDEIIEQSNKTAGLHNLPPKDFIKKIIKAEVVTQFPNLGGNIPDGSDGFQGAVDIRRVTPNKQIGSIDDNPGRGESTKVEGPEEVYDTVPESTLNEDMVKNWEKDKKLLIKGEAYVYEQAESKLKPGSDTGYWYKKLKENSIDQYVTISDGAEVTYTGTYKTNTNNLTKEMVVYVQIETQKKEKVFVRAENLMVAEQDTAGEMAKIENSEITSRAGEGQKLAGKEGETYTIAIAAGHNNTNNTGKRTESLVEEKLTIKTAEKVEELLKEYSNIKVVQTGSTSKNPGGVQDSDRVELARKADPDLCIQIHYDAGGGSGVQAIYKDGDEVSKQLAEFLSKGMANSMGLEDNGAGADVDRCEEGSLGIIENFAKSGFPSVVTEGGFIDGNPDASLLKRNGTDLCAQGIVNGILKYLKADHSGLSAKTRNNETSQESINSRIYNLKYVEPKQMEKYISDGNMEALKVFTLDDDNNLITATWNKYEDESIQLSENSGINFKTALQDCIMPYEYLLYYYIDTNEKKFSEQLADEVLNSEIVIAVQDNINTTKTVETVLEKQVSSNSSYNYEDKVVEGPTTSITEFCTPKIEITYADVWCAKYYKENSYSREALGWSENQQEDNNVNIKGKVTVSNDTSSTGYEQYGDSEVIAIKDENGNAIEEYTCTKYRKTTLDITTMDIEYESGDTKVQGNEGKFIKLYQENKMNRLVRVNYLFKILENNENTANLLDLTKYLIYKSTNRSYGVIEYDFSEFKFEIFTSMNGIYGSTLQEKVWFTLRALGYNEYAVAGAMGNIDLESGGFSESAVEAGGTGIGLIQWSFGRADQLRAYAKSKGVSWKDADTQIEFLVTEITGQGAAKGYATQRKSGWIR